MTRPGSALLIQALTLPLSAPVPASFAARLDRHSHTTYGTTYLVATGPYMVKSDRSGKIDGVGYTAGKSTILVRNPNWNPSTDYRPAYLDRINVKIGGSAIAIGERVLKGTGALSSTIPLRQSLSRHTSRIRRESPLPTDKATSTSR
jgi:peptide/nickel transport system substrate-binding protein